MDYIRYATFSLMMVTILLQFCARPRHNFPQDEEFDPESFRSERISDPKTNFIKYDEIQTEQVNKVLDKIQHDSPPDPLGYPLDQKNNETENDNHNDLSIEIDAPQPNNPLHYFTIWNVLLYTAYSITVTFCLTLEDLSDPTTKFMLRFHYLNLSVQFFIMLFYFSFLWIVVRRYLPWLSALQKFSLDIVHVIPFVNLAIEQAFWRYELRWWEVVYPIGWTMVYSCYTMVIFFGCKITVYPMLDYRNKWTLLWIMISVLISLSCSNLVLFSRDWINSAWV